MWIWVTFEIKIRLKTVDRQSGEIETPQKWRGYLKDTFIIDAVSFLPVYSAVLTLDWIFSPGFYCQVGSVNPLQCWVTKAWEHFLVWHRDLSLPDWRYLQYCLLADGSVVNEFILKKKQKKTLPLAPFMNTVYCAYSWGLTCRMLLILICKVLFKICGNLHCLHQVYVGIVHQPHM